MKKFSHRIHTVHSSKRKKEKLAYKLYLIESNLFELQRIITHINLSENSECFHSQQQLMCKPIYQYANVKSEYFLILIKS